jgi:hypothetical protein
LVVLLDVDRRVRPVRVPWLHVYTRTDDQTHMLTYINLDR